MNRLLRVLFICPLLFGAIDGLAAQDKLQETPYYPLHVGTTWHYRAGESKFLIRVSKHEKVGETLCALLEAVRDDKVVGSQHLAVTAEGVYCHDLSFPVPPGEGKDDKAAEQTMKLTPKPPLLVLKLPLKKGDTWKIDSNSSDGRAFRGSFKVEPQEVKVPAGTYKTFRVTSQDLEVNSLKTTITADYAEGVGMVRQVIESGNAKAEIELEKFEAGKK
jgi:hypothetical protein